MRGKFSWRILSCTAAEASVALWMFRPCRNFVFDIISPPLLIGLSSLNTAVDLFNQGKTCSSIFDPYHILSWNDDRVLYICCGWAPNCTSKARTPRMGRGGGGGWKELCGEEISQEQKQHLAALPKAPVAVCGGRVLGMLLCGCMKSAGKHMHSSHRRPPSPALVAQSNPIKLVCMVIKPLYP